MFFQKYPTNIQNPILVNERSKLFLLNDLKLNIHGTQFTALSFIGLFKFGNE